MKKNYFLGLTGLGLLLITLSSVSGGVAENQMVDRTGSPVSTQSCNHCHSGGSFSASTTIKLKNAAGDEVTKYIPGETYTLELTVNHSGASVFGMLSVALLGDNSSAGTWATKSSNGQLSTVNSRTYGEQNASSSSNVFEFEWEGPTTGSGEVTFFANGLASNGNGNTGGDELAAGGSLAIAEDVSIGVEDVSNTNFNFYPNPAQDYLMIEGVEEQNATIEIYDFSGRIVKQLRATTTTVQVNLDDLSSGTYFVKVGEKEQKIQKIVVH